MINHIFIPFSAVQIYDLSYIHLDTLLNKAELYRIQDKVYKPFTSDVNVD